MPVIYISWASPCIQREKFKVHVIPDLSS